MSASTGKGYRKKADYYTPPGLASAALRAWRRELDVSPDSLTYLEPHVGGGAWLRAMYAQGFARNFGENIEVTDLDPDCVGLHIPGDHLSTVAPSSTESVSETGFLLYKPQRRIDAIIGNPPYGTPRPCPDCAPDPVTVGQGCEKCDGKGSRGVAPLAEAHVKHATKIARHTVFLLRLAFIEGKKRKNAPRLYKLRKVWVTAGRPSYSQICRDCGGEGRGSFGVDCETCEGTGKIKGASGSDNAPAAIFWFDQQYDGSRPQPVDYDPRREGHWEDNPESWEFKTSVLDWASLAGRASNSSKAG